MKPLLSHTAALLLALPLCGCFKYSKEYTTRVTVNSDPQGARFCLDEDGEPGRVVATTPFAMNLRIKVFGSGWEGDQHSRVWGSAGLVAAVFDEQYFLKGTIYQLGLRGILRSEGHEQLRLFHVYYNEHMDRYSTQPWQEIARFSDRKRPPAYITVTIPLIPATDTPSATAQGEKPQTVIISYDRADAIEPRTGTIVVSSHRDGALVFVDERLMGDTPLTLTLFNGFYDLRVASTGRADYETTIRVLADDEIIVEAAFEDVPE